ncbi:MAG TPA: alpha/beta fold hydrolase [Thermoanaerobaculia bacterium]|jgi:pimeloyl-ACP methyl ester carboxylesterase|nr:alpha/beta fold hydrolase [Thermoanaerobaculia bacterium]
MERIPVPAAAGIASREGSHLAVRLDTPPGARPGEAPFCFLYLHGFGSRQEGEKADLFRRSALALGIPFASFDFQGHGQSGGDLRGLTLTRNLADVRRVREWLRERGHERICLIGSSMGGGTALWECALHPEGVVAGLHIAPALEMDRGLLAWAGEEGTRRWRETGAILFQNDLVSSELGWELIEDLQAHPLDELLVRFRTPTLLLQGKRDTSVSWRPVVDFAVRCPYEGIEVHLFADGDHRFLDRLERLWELMVEFLRGRGLLPA